MREAGHPMPLGFYNPEGSGGEGGGREVQDRSTHVYLWPMHVNVWQKPSQYCNYPPVKLVEKKKLLFKNFLKNGDKLMTLHCTVEIY